MVEVFWRAFFTFTILLLLTRVVGKKQLSQLTFFNYITGITIGSISAMLSVDRTLPFSQGSTALITWTGLTIFLGFLSIRSKRVRIFTEGEPTIIIKKGKMVEAAMKDIQITIDEIRMLLRRQGAFSIKDVDYAILEPNGRISLLKKIAQQPVLKSDMNLNNNVPRYFPSEMIVDGKLISRNLRENNLDEKWLSQQLSNVSINQVEDVFYAELQSDGSLYIQPKEKQSKS